jgi:hypothetical protein
MLFAFDPNATSLPPQKRRRLSDSSPKTLPTDKVQPRDVILEGGVQSTDRIVLVARKQDSVHQTDAMEVDNTAEDKIHTSGPTRYDLYRESLKVTSPTTTEAAIKSALKDVSSAHNVVDATSKGSEGDLSNGKVAKGVRFVEQTLSRPIWTRTLLHTNLGPDDILFTPNSLVIQEDTYPIHSWRYRDYGEEAPVEGVNNQNGPKKTNPSTKKRLSKKRRTKRKASTVKDSTAIGEKSSTTVDEKTTEPQPPQEVAPITTGQRTAENKIPPVKEVETKVPEVVTAKKANSQPVVAPTSAREDKEEGELSGSE